MTFEELMDSTPPMQQHALVKGYQAGFAAGAASRDAEIQRLQFALADSEALELGTAEHCDQLRAQINMLRDALKAWETCDLDEQQCDEALAATEQKT